MIIVFLVFNLSIKAQENSPAKQYKQRLSQLIKDVENFNQIQIKDDGIYVYSSEKPLVTDNPEFILFWDEIPFYLSEIYARDYYKMKKWYLEKGTNHLSKDTSFSRTAPTSFEGLKVAIDPGHFAASFQEALFEDKYLKVNKKDLGTKNDKMIYESELNMATALILKDKLDSAGAEVFITRDYGTSAVGINFDKWLQNNFIYDVNHLVASGEMTEQYGEWLQKEASKQEIFKQCYEYLDLTSRARSINFFNPDITYVIHFNSKEDNKRDILNYSKLVDEDYSMAFIGGSFLNGELSKVDARIEFLRLLVSNDIYQSKEIGSILLEEHKRTLGVNPIPLNNSLNHVKYSCIGTDITGLYHRNLYLTRAIQGPVIYGESLYQDNKREFTTLSQKNYEYKGIVTSKRVYEVAQVYFNTIDIWLNSNKTN